MSGPANNKDGYPWWRLLVPVAVMATIALMPSPQGLAQYAWYYFAIFSGVIAALITEPLPNPTVGLIGITVIAVLSRWVLFSPEQMQADEFDPASKSLDWALAGFSSSTVWLVFSAFMFALGYEKTGLGRRIALMLVRALGRNTLMLGYAVVLIDALLAPVTPSNTARSAGTIFPIIRNLPPLYDSLPNEPSARRIGGYIMWTSFAGCAITSSLFMTALAPNLLAVELIEKQIHVQISWQQWFMASAPFALPLLFALPVFVYFFYPPEITHGAQVPTWAATELGKMGRMSRRELVLGVLVLLAILLWVFGTSWMEAATAALLVIGLMLVTRIITWDDMVSNRTAWTTLTLLATLVTLAGGLAKTGFIKWFADTVAGHLVGLSPTAAVVGMVCVYFMSHYMFASLTAHVSALLPVMLAVGSHIPGVVPSKLALALALTTGIMGVITPYATGPGPVYYQSGYIPAMQFWKMGTLFGAIFLAALLLIGVPLLLSG
jgi:L-tartrate/succinate antiporter